MLRDKAWSYKQKPKTKLNQNQIKTTKPHPHPHPPNKKPKQLQKKTILNPKINFDQAMRSLFIFSFLFVVIGSLVNKGDSNNKLKLKPNQRELLGFCQKHKTYNSDFKKSHRVSRLPQNSKHLKL